VRALVETGALVGERGVYRLTTALTRIEVPATVQAILTARIDRLPADDKRLLQAAAVIGRDVPFALLQDVAELPDDQLRRGLTHLQAAEFFYESRLFPDLEYTFKHALTHDVAYAALLHERRRALHGAVLAAIERRAGIGTRGPELAEARAYHAVRAEIWDRAVEALREVETAANALGAIGPSVERLEHALELLPWLPASADNTRRVIDVRLSCSVPFLIRGQIARVGALLREAEQLARDLDDQLRLSQVLRQLGGALLMGGQYTEAAKYEEEVLGLWPRALKPTRRRVPGWGGSTRRSGGSTRHGATRIAASRQHRRSHTPRRRASWATSAPSSILTRDGSTRPSPRLRGWCERPKSTGCRMCSRSRPRSWARRSRGRVGQKRAWRFLLAA
jgi:tetratricopeptide (TPR) repeat protein